MDYSLYNPVAITLLNAGEWKNALLSKIRTTSSVLFIHSQSALRAADEDDRFLTEIGDLPNVAILSGIESNPSIKQLARVRNSLGLLPKTIIALGGGSVIDIAKILKALSGIDASLSTEELLMVITSQGYRNMPTQPIELIALPSTAGTGSELTKWATIWDMENKKKYSIERDEIYPDQAWIDPTLTVGMDKNLTASTGLDALCQAIEAYWSTKTNAFVRRLSVQAIREIMSHLRGAIEEPTNLASREGMCLGSSFAALAFSQTRTTACHALSYPLTARLGIPHGIAVFLSLIPIMRINWEFIEEKPLFLSAFGATTLKEIEEVLEPYYTTYAIPYLEQVVLPDNFLKLIQEDITSMGARLGNNPVEMSEEIIQSVYSSLWTKNECELHTITSGMEH